MYKPSIVMEIMMNEKKIYKNIFFFYFNKVEKFRIEMMIIKCENMYGIPK